jgi:hypothetical protein
MGSFSRGKVCVGSVVSCSTCWLDCGSETDNLPVHWRSLEYAWLPDECAIENKEEEFLSKEERSRSPSHSTSPVLSSGTLGLRFSSLWGSSTYSSCLTASPRLVDSQEKCFDRWK